MSQDDNRPRDTAAEGTSTERKTESMGMVDPSEAERIAKDALGTDTDTESDGETTRKSVQEEGEDLVNRVFRPDGKLRKDTLGDDTETDGVLSERDLEHAQDLQKSDQEVLREIRDELRRRNGTSRGPAAGAGGSPVSKSNVVLKSEDVEDVMEVFREETGVGLHEEGGVRKFYEWLADRVHGDGPGGGPREEKILEKVDEYFEELTERVQEAVAETEDGTA